MNKKAFGVPNWRVKEADLVLIILDERHPSDIIEGEWLGNCHNIMLSFGIKIDVIGQSAGLKQADIVYLSAKAGDGIIELKQLLKQKNWAASHR
ncbi:MAG: hypothetical protein R3E08_01320 [Thiotrichaceae bacterium]